MNTKQVKEMVKSKYGDIAKKSSGCGVTLPSDYAKQIGYKDDDVNSAPSGSNLGLGCGNPTVIETLKKGETVLDLGSGAGFDAFIAARMVGESGRVIGIDMTPEMIAKAMENAKKSNKANVEFRLGEIENLPVNDGSVDVVISNCVINLSPDKPQVFKEAYRVLKKGGRLMVSDIVLDKPLPESIKQNVEAYAACIAGASIQKDYLSAIKKAGFKNIKIVGMNAWLLKTMNLNDRALRSEAVEALKSKLGGDIEKVISLAKSVKSIQVLAWK